ncbi:MAG: S-layer homology domain-containing protein [Clostridia bacterium]|nr:S-layer homology domain-containing protein [Clostridia bacterium]
MKKFLIVLMVALLLATGTNAAFEKVNTYNGNFSDVADSSWYAENVKTAFELGFMNGKSEGKFDPNGNVTVIEGITMTSRLHAIYNDTEVKKSEKKIEEYRFDFDDPSILVDLSERNSRNTNGINFGRATGRIEDGVLIAQPEGLNQHGSYDPQIKFEGLELEAKKYDKVTFRMKRDELPNPNGGARDEKLEFFFKTNVSGSISADKCVKIKLPTDKDLSEWFEVEADLGGHEQWKDLITGFRFDPTNNNGVYYIDYIVLSKSENIKSDKWYDMYVDYATENGLIDVDTYVSDEYSRNITRREICEMFSKAIPEEHFAPINDVKGIPDVLRDEKNADVFLMLYKAGVLLGDENGYFNPDTDIKRSEIAAIINRVALPENRVKGVVSADWASQGNEYDVEFADEASLSKVVIGKSEDVKIVNGALVLKSKDMGDTTKARFDAQIGVENIAIAADDYKKLKVRMKAEYVGEVGNTKFDFYFKTSEDSNLSESKSLHAEPASSGYVDASGWYVIEVDFTTHKAWKGTITGFRFDPGNTNGIYTIDYIRLVKQDPLLNATHEELLSLGYTATRLLQDETFERGFFVNSPDQTIRDKADRVWQDYTDTDKLPLWRISPHWSKYDMWTDRDTTTDEYTIADKYGVNTVTYNPEEKSIIMRQNATKFYNGAPHINEEQKWWPHLLLSQDTNLAPLDKKRNSASADRMFMEIDVRMNDFKNTTNPEGTNNAFFGINFYMRTDKAPNELIWFGFNIFHGISANDRTTPGWSPDSAAHSYMYGIRPATVFGGIENSFNPEPDVVVTGDEWKHIRVDVTPHIERAMEWANRDNAFGVPVTAEDMYFEGANIGFETHGNYDYTFEFKNFNMVAYNK